MSVAVSPMEDRRMRGIALMMAAFICFTMIDTSAKWLVLGGMPSMQVAFVRYSLHTVIILSLFMPREGFGLFATRNWKIELLRALALLSSTLLNFTAIRYLPLTLTAAIMFTSPLFVCALSIPLLGEKVRARRWAAIILGFGGVLIATRPWGAEVHWAVLLSLTAAICVSFYVIFTRMLAASDASATQQAWAATVATVGVAPFAFADWTWPADSVGWGAFFAVGVFGWLGHQFLTVAHRFAPASTLAPFIYTQMIYMTASSWFVFGQPPDIWVICGAVVVGAAGLYIWLRERQLAGG